MYTRKITSLSSFLIGCYAVLLPWLISTLLCPAPRVGALGDDARLTSVAYIGLESRTERPRKTKIGTEVAHVTHDSDTTFKVKRSKVNLQGAGHIVAASRTAFVTVLYRGSPLNRPNLAPSRLYTSVGRAVCVSQLYCWRLS